MSFAGFGGDATMVTGVEDMDDGALKVYVGPRYNGIYCIVDDEEGKAAVRRAWGQGGHVFTAMPPADALFQDEKPLQAEAEAADTTRNTQERAGEQ